MVDQPQSQPHPRILIIGDMMIDRYLRCSCDRISPEAPVPVVKVIRKDDCPGGAGNLSENLKALGAVVRLYSSDISTKMRVVVGHHQMIRLDSDTCELLEPTAEMKQDVIWADAVILCDYGKGAVSPDVVECVSRWTFDYKKPLLVEPYTHRTDYGTNVDLIKPNVKAVESVVGDKVTIDNGIRLATEYWSKVRSKHMVMTWGARGMYYFTKNRPPKHFPPQNVINVFDVTGAGDTAMAVLSFIWAQPKFSRSTAVWWATKAASLVVQKPGTAVIGFDELFGKYSNGFGLIQDLD